METGQYQMASENGDGTATKLKAEEGGKRQRSSIAFPYMDLNEAVTLAKAVHNNVGTGTCSVEQLAPWVLGSSKVPQAAVFARASRRRVFLV